MTSLSDTIATHNTEWFFNTDHFGVVGLRYAGGINGEASQVTAVLSWNETHATQDRGRGSSRTGQLMLLDTQTVTVQDVFKIGVDTVCVTAVGPIQDRARTVTVTQHIPETKGVKSLRAGDL